MTYKTAPLCITHAKHKKKLIMLDNLSLKLFSWI